MQSNPKTKKWIIGIAALVLVVLAVILLLTMCSPNTSDDPTDPVPGTTDPLENPPDSTDPPDVPPDTHTQTLDAMDDLGAWIGSSPAAQTDAEGRKWLGSSSRDEQGSVVLSRAFAPAVDMRGYANGYLKVNIYVEDLSKMVGGELELSSSSNPDARELSWNLMLYLTKSGWNEVYLPFANGNKVGGEIDLQNVNFMRIYGIMTEDCLFGADEIVLTNEEPAEKSHLDEKGQFVIDEVESLGAWIGTAPSLVSSKPPVGSGYVFTNQKDGDALVLSRPLDNLDMSAFKDGYLHLWVYVKDVSRLTGGQIELSSAGIPDKNETGWDLLAYVKQNGWNELYLPVSQALNISGGADFSAINYIRVFALTTGSNALGVDYVCMSNEAPPEPSRIDANNQYVIDKVEAIETWVGSKPYMSSSGAAKGSRWLATKSVDEAGSAVFARLLTNLDAYAYRNGYLHMYLYIENVDLVTGGQIELSSAGEADKKETSWNIGGLDLKNGWNELYLPIQDATKVGGGANFSNLNFIRIYVTTKKAQTVGVDYIALSRTAPERDDPVDENGNYIIDYIKGVSPWSGGELVYNTASGYQDGADWLSDSASAARDIVFFRNFATADLTGYADGYLHLWFYVDDISHLSGGMIEITSTGTVDDGELYWPLASYVTKSGWNELYLPFNAAIPEGANAADMSKMNTLRIVAMLGSAGGNVGIDEIYATNTEPPVAEPEFDGVIDPIGSVADWQGTPLTYHENGGYIPGADYISTTLAAPGDLVFFRVFPAVDATAFAEGGVQLWVYIDDVTKLTGGMIEITSSGTVDNEELWWPIANYVTQSGWNLVYLPFADAQAQGDTAVDMTQLDCLRVVMGISAEATGGIDELALVKEAPGSEKIIILPGDTLNATWGNELTLVDTDAPVGSYYIKTGSAVSSVVCANMIPPANIQGYEHTGELHLWLYIEDVSQMIDGQIELTSSGLSDDAETAWNLTPAMLQNGWNELTLNFSDAVYTGATNYAAVNYMRLYINFTEAASIGVDEIYVGGIKTNVTPPEDDTTMEEAIAQATANSVLYEGSANMKAAIAAVLEKAKNGEAITLVTLGDSITAGAVAPAGQEWASLVKNYLEALDGDANNGNVTLVNAGIGSTEAVLGVSRVEKDVLSKTPDLVIVDFGTNDYGLPYGAEAYEGILCKLISAGVPVINSNVCPASGNNIQNAQLPINMAYGVPMVSFKTAYYELSTTTSIVGLRTGDIWSSDNVHPTTAGHKLLADLLTAYLQTYIVDANVTAGTLNTTLPEKVTNNGFADAVMVENFTENSPVEVTLNGWTGDYAARIYQLSTEGWQTSTVGSSITFRVNAGYFYMFFELDSNCGDLEIAVDGVVNSTINWAYLGTGYMNAHHIIHLAEAGEHTITITLRDNANVENDWAGICAVGAANFSGYTVEEASDGIIDMITADSTMGGTYTTTAAHTEGAGWSKLTAAANTDAVFYKTFAPMDLSSFSEGYLHLWLYVDDISNLRPYSGMIELTSAGVVDNEEIYWTIHGQGLKSGWNELYLAVEDAVAEGTAPIDLTQVDTMRIVGMAGANGAVFGVDEIYMTNEANIQIDPDYATAVEQANKDAILYAGSDNMKSAIAAVLEKAKNGETVKLVVSGSSTPAGAGADAGKGEADLIRTWLDELDGENDGNVTLVNTAIGSTENVFGVSRMDKDILAHDPDLVIIDFGNAGPHMKEAHEGVLTKLIQAGVPTICSCFCPADGSGDKLNYLPINEAYGVPHLDFKTAYWELARTTQITGLRVEDIWYFDNVHPSNTGHKLLAEMAIYYLQTQILDQSITPGTLDTKLPEKVTNNGFADAILVENFTTTDKVQITKDGWTDDYAARIYQLSTEGWQTSTVGSSITFKVNAGYFYMFFELDSNSGDLEISVDGNVKQTINWACNGTGYMNPYYVFNFAEAGEHTVTMTLKDNATVENDWFGICAVGASNFEGYTPVLPDSMVIVEGETISPWFSLNSVELISTDAPVGTNFIRTTNAARDPSIAAGLTGVDISGYLQSGYLHFWLYVEDASAVTGGQIELNSHGTAPNEAEIAWNLTELGLKNGWNELYLPFAEAISTDGTSGAFSGTVKYIRIWTVTSNEAKIAVDKMEATKTKPETPDVPDTPAADFVISEVEAQDVWVSGMGIALQQGNAAVGDNWLQVGTLTTEPAWATTASGFTPFDLTPYAEGYLRVRIYINEGSEFQYGRIELSSAMMPDNSEIAWDFAGKDIQPGWNDLYLPVSEGVTTDGTTGPVDLTQINYVHIALCTPDGQFGFDKIELTNTKPAEPEPEPEPVADLVISEVEANDLWFSGEGFTLETSGAAVGSNWIKSATNYWPAVVHSFNPTVDLTPYAESGYLHTWIYVSNAANVAGGQFELCSAGAPDTAELAWNFTDMGLVDGWNEVYLPLAEAIRTDGASGPINLAAMNYIRIFMGFATPDSFGFDKIELTMTKPEAPEPVADLVISTVDTLDAWFGADGYGLMPSAAVGNNWIISPKDYWPAVVSAFNPTFDVSAYAESGYLHMWLYVPSAANVAGGQIELSSASAPDSAEIGWDLTSLNLRDGWNELYLPFASGIKVDGAGGPVDLTQINYIRIYAGFAAPSFFGFDKIEATMTQDGTGESKLISEVEALELWFGAEGYGLMGSAAVGSNWMKSPKDFWPAVVSAFNPTFDVSAYAENGYLHMWIYVRDAANVAGGQIELSSASSGDASEIGWNVADLGLKTGWNEVYLPFASGIKADGATGPVDLTKINYIRIYLGFNSADWFGFDKMEATMSKP